MIFEKESKVDKQLGPTFGEEITAAGLSGLLAWNADGVIIGRDDLDDDQNATLDVVINDHDPTRMPEEDYLKPPPGSPNG